MMINEFDRLNAVNRFTKLDAGIKKDLNELVNLVAQICNVPVALITLIDEKMQWFKASVGTGEINCNERQLSFCQQTILQNDLLIVNDPGSDKRFANLPIVTGEPYIKFYAGVPLITYDGHAVGTLCVLHVQPVQLTELQINSIKVLSKQVLNLIELNWSMQTLMEQNLNTQHQKKVLEESEIKLKAIFDSSKDIHLLVSRKMEILAFNKAAYNYVWANYKKALTTGVHLLNVTNQDFADMTIDNIQCALKGETVEVEWLLRSEEKSRCWLEISFVPVLGTFNNIIGVAVNATDITLRKLDAEQIEQQNAALQRIATIQSHELRRPVASLMGLMDVLKMDEGYVYNSYYPMIEITINELDNKIKDIVHDSEQTLGCRAY
ncbi:GAF domain-containing protein [Mucilaginibacter terrae]|uniref:GAF domain-containing protein n=1 Tax=Mucilaginibacter terrae TaxID=1955052 RepID=UPI00363D0553